MKIILTGGTILKGYNVDTGAMEVKDGSDFDHCMEDMNLTKEYDVHAWWGMKDSIFMTESDRYDMYKFCKSRTDGRLLVIHGTDTISETHKYFCEQDSIGTVVFTGAFFPLCLKWTEGEFNLGFALASAKLLPEGNYVAMNGEVFTENVKKDFENLTFEGKTI